MTNSTTLLRSCDHCRAKHSKCDSKQPCSNCLKENFSCHYSQRKKRQNCPLKRELRLKKEIVKLKNQIKHAREEAEHLKKIIMKKSDEKKIILNDIRLYLNASLYSFVNIARVCNPFMPQDVSGNFFVYFTVSKV
jgi:hypothetical protein